jgi:hypothetical protein
MNDFEIQRLENIQRNRQILKDLNLHQLPTSTTPDRQHPVKRRKFESAPSRISARIASSTRPSYDEDEVEKPRKLVHTRINRSASKSSFPRSFPKRDTNSLQLDWTSWEPVAPLPTRDESGALHFASHPSFLPNKSPEEVIREGCFGGSYFRLLKSQRLGITIENDYKDLPSSWIIGLDVERYLTSPKYDADVNKFKVVCGQSIEEWEAAGWINHDYDVRGWFQWYTRFFRGRRCEDDDRQVSRWKKCVGETGRWRRMLLKKYLALGVREVFDDGADEDAPEVSPVMHQTCHHWAFEVRQNLLDDYWSSGH